ncbi:MAG: sensor histidine kinase [Chloroflexi bacterium]|nr:sensor histidine kinase [Chloroflexota bacterium]
MDALRLGQVLANLIDNASKYSPETEPIEVEISVLSDETVRISVTDHGVGVPPEHREHIFDRFYQAERRYPLCGLGLGLFISKQIVEMHGGTVEVQFPGDGGTRMVVTLPAGQPL